MINGPGAILFFRDCEDTPQELLELLDGVPMEPHPVVEACKIAEVDVEKWERLQEFGLKIGSKHK